MGRFQGFYTGVDDTVGTNNCANISETELFAKRRQKQDNSTVSKRQLNIWSSDLSRCSSLTDYQNYVKKYDRPDNPFVSEAKQKIDDLTFVNCKSIADYNNYLSLFPSGKNAIKAKAAIRRLQSNITSINSSSSYTPSSHNSRMSSEDVWGFVKKAIGVICVLLMIADLYLMFTDQIPKSAGVGFGVLILGPVGKWAFDE